MGEVTVRVVDMEYGVDGCVFRDADGNYSVYINARNSYEVQQETLKHELKHILDDDFDNGLPIQLVEGA